MAPPLRIGVSACLVGQLVRYDGGHSHAPSLVQWLEAHAELWPICPEVEIGMGTPREPVELQRSPNGVASGEHRVRIVGAETGTSWTSRMHEWAMRQARKWAEAGVGGAVLKSGSASCGVTGVVIHSGPLRLSGRGLFAEALATVMPGLPMVEEGDLHEAVAREAFLAAVRARHPK